MKLKKLFMGRKRHREINFASRIPYNSFQLDATVYPGGSGSPLYHPETGQVIGVVNMTLIKKTKEHLLSDPSSIVYAIPAQHIERLFE